ncbi:replicative DNA helicase, partial [Candidatus Woesebacteria bacterium]|nr:replicative DNA helicase [Candidatus Woesebacteria bacterium]
MATGGNRIPPQNIEAEESVLGAVLLDKDAIIQVADVLKPEYFYVEANRHVYDAMFQLYEKREPIDVITLTNQLKAQKKLKNVGGSAYLAKLANSVPTAAHAKHYATIVKNMYTKREIIRMSGEVDRK